MAAQATHPTLSYDHLFKLLLIGDASVGKTSIILQFTQGAYDEHQRNTIGVDVKVKMMNVDQSQVKLTIWDTAGQERFRTLTSSYYRGAHAVVFVYDITARESYNNITAWMDEVKTYNTNEHLVMMLVGNKIDMDDARMVSKEEAATFARAHSMLFIECSAKTKQGVQQAFDELVQKVLDTVRSPALSANAGDFSSGGGKKVDFDENEFANRDRSEQARCC